MSGQKAGRPENKQMMESFEDICEWLENYGDCELYTVRELHKMMDEKNSGNVYSITAFRQKLKDRYQDHVYFFSDTGRPYIVCFKDMTNFIIRNMIKTNETKESVISAAAKMIRSEIRNMNVSKSYYPSVSEIEDSEKWIPESLEILLGHLISSTLKKRSIGQCIVQAARPRSAIAPIPFGLGIELDLRFGSKWLVNQLARFGITIKADEVVRFKQFAIENADNDNSYASVPFKQWVADNVDHNIATLTAKGTFHGMGVISISSGESTQKSAKIPRLGERKRMDSVVSKKGIEIKHYTNTLNGASKLQLKSILEIKTAITLPSTLNYNFLWHYGWFSSSDSHPRPNWSGFVQNAISTNKVFSKQTKSSIEFLPIIDLNPSNETYIYSTLSFVIKEASRFHVVPCITFDQPLWLKAICIIKEKSLPIVCRLGGFHTLMSFLGSIGNWKSL